MKTNKTLFIILICSLIQSFRYDAQAQSYNCDSLKSDISEVEYMLHYEPFDSSINKLNLLENTADSLNCDLEQSTVFVILGYFYIDEGIHLKALENLQKGLSIRQKLKDTLKIVSVYSNLIRLEVHKNFPQHGLLYSDTALHLLSQVQNDTLDLTAKVKINKADCLNQLGRYGEAQKLYEEIARDTTSVEYSSAIQGLGDLAFEAKTFTRALKYYEEVFDIYKKEWHPYYLSQVARSIGLTNLELKDTTLAIQYFFTSVDTAAYYDYKLLYLDAYFELIKIISKYQGLSSDERANYNTILKTLIPREISVDSVLLQLDKRGKEDSLAIGSHQERADIRNQLAEFFREEGDFEKAYAYQQGILSLEGDWVKQMEVEKKLSAQYEADLKMEKERARARRIRAYFIFGLLGLVIVSLFLYLKNRRLALQRTEQSLEIERYSREKEHELRQQLSFETHDIKTMAAGVRNFIQFLTEGLNPPKEVQNILKSAYPLSEKLVGQLERITKALKPNTKEGFVLLGLLFSRLENEKSIQVSLQKVPNLEQLIDEDFAYKLFVMLDVLIDNTKRYAEASELLISLKQKQQQLIVRVEDNGNGNFSYPQNTGTGLTSVAVRVKELNGKLNINTQNGTKVRMELPLKNQ